MRDLAEEEAPELAELVAARDEEAPEIDASLHWIWRCWLRLHDERPHLTTGVGVPMGAILITPRPRKIPWSTLAKWAETYEITDENFDILNYCIQKLDEEFLVWWNAENKARSNG